MDDYSKKSYGRNAEVSAIYRLFGADHDVAMPGPRRLGKTFLLDRLVEASDKHGWIAIKVDVAGCADPRAFFRELCDKIAAKNSRGDQAIKFLQQRVGQLLAPRADPAGSWYQPLTSVDYETYVERLLKAMNDEPERRWVLLIDELPIFLKGLHDKEGQGVKAARNFMNLFSRLRAANPRVRWMVTGSIGMEPLAQAGQYIGALAKFHPYELHPLEHAQAEDYVKDLARTRQLLWRSAITDTEARAIVAAVGWRAAYYLEALAQQMNGEPSEDPEQADQHVEDAMQRLLQPALGTTFGVWEEHLTKHYPDPDRAIAFAVLAILAPHPDGRGVDTLLAGIERPELAKNTLRSLLTRLHAEGFVAIREWESENPTAAFLNPLLRRWWHRFKPHAAR